MTKTEGETEDTREWAEESRGGARVSTSGAGGVPAPQNGRGDSVRERCAGMSDRKREKFPSEVFSEKDTGAAGREDGDSGSGLHGNKKQMTAHCNLKIDDSYSGVCTPHNQDGSWRGVGSDSLLGWPTGIVNQREDGKDRSGGPPVLHRKKKRKEDSNFLPPLEREEGRREDLLLSLRNQEEGMSVGGKVEQGETIDVKGDLNPKGRRMESLWRTRERSSLLPLPEERHGRRVSPQHSPGLLSALHQPQRHLRALPGAVSLLRGGKKTAGRDCSARRTYLTEKEESRKNSGERDSSILREGALPNPREGDGRNSLVSVYLPLAPMPGHPQSTVERGTTVASPQTLKALPSSPASSSSLAFLRNRSTQKETPRRCKEREASCSDSSSSSRQRRLILDRFPLDLLKEISSMIPRDPLLAKVANRGTADAFLSLRFLVSRETFGTSTPPPPLPSSSSSSPALCPPSPFVSQAGRKDVSLGQPHGTDDSKTGKRQENGGGEEEGRKEQKREKRRAVGIEISSDEKAAGKETHQEERGEVEEEEQGESTPARRRREKSEEGEEDAARKKQGEGATGGRMDSERDSRGASSDQNLQAVCADTPEAKTRVSRGIFSSCSTLSSSSSVAASVFSSSGSPREPLCLVFVWYRRRGTSMRLCIPRVPDLVRKVISFFFFSAASSASSPSSVLPFFGALSRSSSSSRIPGEERSRESRDGETEEKPHQPTGSLPSASSSSSSRSCFAGHSGSVRGQSSGACTGEGTPEGPGVRTAGGKKQLTDGEWGCDRSMEEVRVTGEGRRERLSSTVGKQDGLADEMVGLKDHLYLKATRGSARMAPESSVSCTAEAAREKKAFSHHVQCVCKEVTSHAYWPRMKTSLDGFLSSLTSSSPSSAASTCLLNAPQRSALAGQRQRTPHSAPVGCTAALSHQDDTASLRADSTRDVESSVFPSLFPSTPSSSVLSSSLATPALPSASSLGQGFAGVSSRRTRETSKGEEGGEQGGRSRHPHAETRASPFSCSTPRLRSSYLAPEARPAPGATRDRTLTTELQNPLQVSPTALTQRVNDSLRGRSHSLEGTAEEEERGTTWTPPPMPRAMTNVTQKSIGQPPMPPPNSPEMSCKNEEKRPLSASAERKITCCFDRSVYDWLMTCSRPGETLKDVEIQSYEGPTFSSSASSTESASLLFFYIFRKKENEETFSSFLADRGRPSSAAVSSAVRHRTEGEKRKGKRAREDASSPADVETPLAFRGRPARNTYASSLEERQQEDEQYYSLGEERFEEEEEETAAAGADSADVVEEEMEKKKKEEKEAEERHRFNLSPSLFSFSPVHTQGGGGGGGRRAVVLDLVETSTAVVAPVCVERSPASEEAKKKKKKNATRATEGKSTRSPGRMGTDPSTTSGTTPASSSSAFEQAQRENAKKGGGRGRGDSEGERADTAELHSTSLKMNLGISCLRRAGEPSSPVTFLLPDEGRVPGDPPPTIPSSASSPPLSALPSLPSSFSSSVPSSLCLPSFTGVSRGRQARQDGCNVRLSAVPADRTSLAPEDEEVNETEGNRAASDPVFFSPISPTPLHPSSSSSCLRFSPLLPPRNPLLPYSAEKTTQAHRDHSGGARSSIPLYAALSPHRGGEAISPFTLLPVALQDGHLAPARTSACSRSSPLSSSIKSFSEDKPVSLFQGGGDRAASTIFPDCWKAQAHHDDAAPLGTVLSMYRPKEATANRLFSSSTTTTVLSSSLRHPSRGLSPSSSSFAPSTAPVTEDSLSFFPSPLSSAPPTPVIGAGLRGRALNACGRDSEVLSSDSQTPVTGQGEREAPFSRGVSASSWACSSLHAGVSSAREQFPEEVDRPVLFDWLELATMPRSPPRTTSLAHRASSSSCYRRHAFQEEFSLSLQTLPSSPTSSLLPTLAVASSSSSNTFTYNDRAHTYSQEQSNRDSTFLISLDTLACTDDTSFYATSSAAPSSSFFIPPPPGLERVSPCHPFFSLCLSCPPGPAVSRQFSRYESPDGKESRRWSGSPDDSRLDQSCWPTSLLHKASDRGIFKQASAPSSSFEPQEEASVFSHWTAPLFFTPPSPLFRETANEEAPGSPQEKEPGEEEEEAFESKTFKGLPPPYHCASPAHSSRAKCLLQDLPLGTEGDAKFVAGQSPHQENSSAAREEELGCLNGGSVDDGRTRRRKADDPSECCLSAFTGLRAVGEMKGGREGEREEGGACGKETEREEVNCVDTGPASRRGMVEAEGGRDRKEVWLSYQLGEGGAASTMTTCRFPFLGDGAGEKIDSPSDLIQSQCHGGKRLKESGKENSRSLSAFVGVLKETRSVHGERQREEQDVCTAVQGREREEEEEECSASFTSRKIERAGDASVVYRLSRTPGLSKKRIRQLLENHDLILPGVEAAEPLLPTTVLDLLEEGAEEKEEKEAADRWFKGSDPKTSPQAWLRYVVTSFLLASPPQLLHHPHRRCHPPALPTLPWTGPPHLILSGQQKVDRFPHVTPPSCRQSGSARGGGEEEGHAAGAVSGVMAAAFDRLKEPGEVCVRETGTRGHEKKRRAIRKKWMTGGIEGEEENLRSLAVPCGMSGRVGRRIGLVAIDLFHLFADLSSSSSPSTPPALFSSPSGTPPSSASSSSPGLSISPHDGSIAREEENESEDNPRAENDEVDHGSSSQKQLPSVSFSSVPFPSSSFWYCGAGAVALSREQEEGLEERDKRVPIDAEEAGADERRHREGNHCAGSISNTSGRRGSMTIVAVDGRQEASAPSLSLLLPLRESPPGKGLPAEETAGGSLPEAGGVEIGTEGGGGGAKDEKRKESPEGRTHGWSLADRKLQTEGRSLQVFSRTTAAERLSQALWTACTYLRLDTLCICLTTAPAGGMQGGRGRRAGLASRCLGYRCISVLDVPRLPSLLACWREQLLLSSQSSMQQQHRPPHQRQLVLATPNFFPVMKPHAQSEGSRPLPSAASLKGAGRGEHVDANRNDSQGLLTYFFPSDSILSSGHATESGHSADAVEEWKQDDAGEASVHRLMKTGRQHLPERRAGSRTSTQGSRGSSARDPSISSVGSSFYEESTEMGDSLSDYSQGSFRLGWVSDGREERSGLSTSRRRPENLSAPSPVLLSPCHKILDTEAESDVYTDCEEESQGDSLGASSDDEAKESSFLFEEEWVWPLLLHLMEADLREQGGSSSSLTNLNTAFLTGLFLLNACADGGGAMPSIQAISLYPVEASVSASSSCTPEKSTRGRVLFSSLGKTFESSCYAASQSARRQTGHLQGVLLSTFFRERKKLSSRMGSSRLTSTRQAGRDASRPFSFQRTAEGNFYYQYPPGTEAYSSFFSRSRGSSRRPRGRSRGRGDIDDCLDFLLGALSSSYEAAGPGTRGTGAPDVAVSRGGWEGVWTASHGYGKPSYPHRNAQYWTTEAAVASSSAYLRGRPPFATTGCLGGGRRSRSTDGLLALTYNGEGHQTSDFRCPTGMRAFDGTGTGRRVHGEEGGGGRSPLETYPSTVYLSEPSHLSCSTSCSPPQPCCSDSGRFFSFPSPLDEVVFLDTRAFFEPDVPSPPHPLVTGLYGAPSDEGEEEEGEYETEGDRREDEECQRAPVENTTAKGRLRMHRLSGVLCVQAAVALLSLSLPTYTRRHLLPHREEEELGGMPSRGLSSSSAGSFRLPREEESSRKNAGREESKKKRERSSQLSFSARCIGGVSSTGAALHSQSEGKKDEHLTFPCVRGRTTQKHEEGRRGEVCPTTLSTTTVATSSPPEGHKRGGGSGAAESSVARPVLPFQRQWAHPDHGHHGDGSLLASRSPPPTAWLQQFLPPGTVRGKSCCPLTAALTDPPPPETLLATSHPEVLRYSSPGLSPSSSPSGGSAAIRRPFRVDLLQSRQIDSGSNSDPLTPAATTEDSVRQLSPASKSMLLASPSRDSMDEGTARKRHQRHLSLLSRETPPRGEGRGAAVKMKVDDAEVREKEKQVQNKSSPQPGRRGEDSSFFSSQEEEKDLSSSLRREEQTRRGGGAEGVSGSPVVPASKCGTVSLDRFMNRECSDLSHPLSTSKTEEPEGGILSASSDAGLRHAARADYGKPSYPYGQHRQPHRHPRHHPQYCKDGRRQLVRRLLVRALVHFRACVSLSYPPRATRTASFSFPSIQPTDDGGGDNASEPTRSFPGRQEAEKNPALSEGNVKSFPLQHISLSISSANRVFSRRASPEESPLSSSSRSSSSSPPPPPLERDPLSKARQSAMAPARTPVPDVGAPVSTRKEEKGGSASDQPACCSGGIRGREERGAGHPDASIVSVTALAEEKKLQGAWPREQEDLPSLCSSCPSSFTAVRKTEESGKFIETMTAASAYEMLADTFLVEHYELLLSQQGQDLGGTRVFGGGEDTSAREGRRSCSGGEEARETVGKKALTMRWGRRGEPPGWEDERREKEGQEAIKMAIGGMEFRGERCSNQGRHGRGDVKNACHHGTSLGRPVQDSAPCVIFSSPSSSSRPWTELQRLWGAQEHALGRAGQLLMHAFHLWISSPFNKMKARGNDGERLSFSACATESGGSDRGRAEEAEKLKTKQQVEERVVHPVEFQGRSRGETESGRGGPVLEEEEEEKEARKPSIADKYISVYCRMHRRLKTKLLRVHLCLAYIAYQQYEWGEEESRRRGDDRRLLFLSPPRPGRPPTCSEGADQGEACEARGQMMKLKRGGGTERSSGDTTSSTSSTSPLSRVLTGGENSEDDGPSATTRKSKVDNRNTSQKERQSHRLVSVHANVEEKNKKKEQAVWEELRTREQEDWTGPRRMGDDSSCHLLGKTLQHLLLASCFLPFSREQKHLVPPGGRGGVPTRTRNSSSSRHGGPYPLPTHSSSFSSSPLPSAVAPGLPSQRGFDRTSAHAASHSQGPRENESRREEQIKDLILTASLGRWLSEILMRLSLHHLRHKNEHDRHCTLAPPRMRRGSRASSSQAGRGRAEGEGRQKEDSTTMHEKDRRTGKVKPMTMTAGCQGVEQGRVSPVRREEKKENKLAPSSSCSLKEVFLAVPSWALPTLCGSGISSDGRGGEKAGGGGGDLQARTSQGNESFPSSSSTPESHGSSSSRSSITLLGDEPWLPVREDTVLPDREKLLNLAIRFSLRSLHICAEVRDLIRDRGGEGGRLTATSISRRRSRGSPRGRAGREREEGEDRRCPVLKTEGDSGCPPPSVSAEDPGGAADCRRWLETVQQGDQGDVWRGRGREEGVEEEIEVNRRKECFQQNKRTREPSLCKKGWEKKKWVVVLAAAEELEEASKRVVARAYGDLGSFYAETGRSTKALIHCKQGIELFEAIGDMQAASGLHLTLSCFLLQPFISSPSASHPQLSAASFIMTGGEASACLSSSTLPSAQNGGRGAGGANKPSGESHALGGARSSLSSPLSSLRRPRVFPQNLCACTPPSSSSPPPRLACSSLLATSTLPQDSYLSLSLRLLHAAERGHFASGSDIFHSKALPAVTDGEPPEKAGLAGRGGGGGAGEPCCTSALGQEEDSRHRSTILQCIARLEQQERRLQCAIEEQEASTVPRRRLPSGAASSPACLTRSQRESSGVSRRSSSSVESGASTSMSSLECAFLDQGQQRRERKKNAKDVKHPGGGERKGRVRRTKKKVREVVAEGASSVVVIDGMTERSVSGCPFCYDDNDGCGHDRGRGEAEALKRLYGGVSTLLACLYIYLARWQLKELPLLVRPPPPPSRANEYHSCGSRNPSADTASASGEGGLNRSTCEVSHNSRETIVRASKSPEEGEGRGGEEEEETEDGEKKADSSSTNQEKPNDKKVDVKEDLKRNPSGYSSGRLEGCWFASEAVNSLPFGLLSFLHLKTCLRDIHSDHTRSPKSGETRRRADDAPMLTRRGCRYSGQVAEMREEERPRLHDEEEFFGKILFPFDNRGVEAKEEEYLSEILEKTQKSLARVLELYETQESILLLLACRCGSDGGGGRLAGLCSRACGNHLDLGLQAILVQNAAGLAHLFLSCIALREVYVHRPKRGEHGGGIAGGGSAGRRGSRRRANGEGGGLSQASSTRLMTMLRQGRLRRALHHADKASEALQTFCLVEAEKREEDAIKRMLLPAASKPSKKERKTEGRREQKSEKNELKETDEKKQRMSTICGDEEGGHPPFKGVCEACRLEIRDTDCPVYVHHPNPPCTAFVSSCLLLSFTYELIATSSPSVISSSSSSCDSKSSRLGTASAIPTTTLKLPLSHSITSLPCRMITPEEAIAGVAGRASDRMCSSPNSLRGRERRTPSPKGKMCRNGFSSERRGHVSSDLGWLAVRRLTSIWPLLDGVGADPEGLLLEREERKTSRRHPDPYGGKGQQSNQGGVSPTSAEREKSFLRSPGSGGGRGDGSGVSSLVASSRSHEDGSELGKESGGGEERGEQEVVRSESSTEKGTAKDNQRRVEWLGIDMNFNRVRGTDAVPLALQRCALQRFFAYLSFLHQGKESACAGCNESDNPLRLL